MPLLEIKGLGADIADIKKGIGDLRDAAKSLSSEKQGLLTEMNDVRDQLRKHRSDLRFEAETLGNSSNSSDEETGEKPKDAKLLGNVGETTEEKPPVVS